MLTGRTVLTWAGFAEERLAKLNAELEKSDLGALLAFDFANIRYMSSTHIGTWAVDKMIRFALITRTTDPIVWDFGSAAKHHQLYNPWLADRQRSTPSARPSSRREAFAKLVPGPGSRPCAAPSTRIRGWPRASPPRFGGSWIGQAWPMNRSVSMSSRCRCSPRCSKQASRWWTASRCSSTLGGSNPDEVSLLTQAASMVDAAYEDLYQFLRPGVRENECVGLV